MALDNFTETFDQHDFVNVIEDKAIRCRVRLRGARLLFCSTGDWRFTLDCQRRRLEEKVVRQTQLYGDGEFSRLD
jgi:hypothetical protein